LKRHHGATLQLLLGFIVGSLPVLWPWRQLVRYQLGSEGQVIPLGYRYLSPDGYSQLTGESAQLLAVVAAVIAGGALVWLVGRAGRPAALANGDNKESSNV